MPPVPPSQAELEALAERALAAIEPPGQATAWWERTQLADPDARSAQDAVWAELAVLRDGRVGLARTTHVDEAGLARAAAAAAAAVAGGPPGALGEPAPGRAHQGYDPAVAGLDPAALPVQDDGVALRWRAAAAKVAVASSRGVRAYEQRSHMALEAVAAREGRSVRLRVAAVGPGGIDAAALAAEARAALGDGEPEAVAPGEHQVVLGPDAVAEVLDRARAALAAGGPLAPRLGTRVMASCINLSDSPRFPGTLPRSYDVRGVPRSPQPVIQDGVAHRLLEAPAAAHLVLVGGGAADLGELLAPVGAGLYLATLEGPPLHVRDGRLGPPADARLEIDPLRVLASAQALSARQRAVPVGPPTAREANAVVAPALRAAGGVLVR